MGYEQGHGAINMNHQTVMVPLTHVVGNKGNTVSLFPLRPAQEGCLFLAGESIVIRLDLSGDFYSLGAFLFHRCALLDRVHAFALDFGDVDLVAVLVAPLLRLRLCGKANGIGTLLRVLEREHRTALRGGAAGNNVGGRM